MDTHGGLADPWPLTEEEENPIHWMQVATVECHQFSQLVFGLEQPIVYQQTQPLLP